MTKDSEIIKEIFLATIFIIASIFMLSNFGCVNKPARKLYVYKAHDGALCKNYFYGKCGATLENCENDKIYYCQTNIESWEVK